MNTRTLIGAADPVRALRPDALELDVDGLLSDFASQDPEPARSTSGPTPPRRRLDLALAAVVVAFLAAVAFLPAALPHGAPARHGASRATSAADGTAAEAAAATALLDGIRLPAAAKRVAAPPAQYLAEPRMGLACEGQASASPRYWIVPGTTLHAVADFLQSHRPADATRLPFDHSTDGASTAFTMYRPSTHSLVVIALATTPTGVGIRADADVLLGRACVAPR